MGLKQKFSALAAAVLPALALSAYFLIAPHPAAAGSCPSGEIYAPCAANRCSTGASCVGVGSHTVFVFCDGGYGTGTCVSTSCVKCDSD